MAFTNEYVSEEDIRKYNLKEIWFDNNAIWKMKGKLPPSYRLYWTIDRERDVYLMCVGIAGREEVSIEFVLYHQRDITNFVLFQPVESSKKHGKHYNIIWNMEDISPKLKGNEKDEVIDLLKEALTIYGYHGIREQIPNTIVSFNF